MPVAIYNNQPGGDRKTLEHFGERAWNNPVLRFVDTGEQDLIPRKDGVYTTGEVLQRMTMALRQAKRKVPTYLELVAGEYAPGNRQRATFAVSCYWVGERKLGRLAGVLGTRIGMLKGREVVEVDFDSSVIPFTRLLAAASQLECFSRVFARTGEQEKAARAQVGDRVTRTDAAVDTTTQQQYDLFQRKSYYYLPLTQLQATRLNAALPAGGNAGNFLSPAQRALLPKIQKRLQADPKSLDRLQPDRTPARIGTYRKRLEAALSAE